MVQARLSHCMFSLVLLVGIWLAPLAPPAAATWAIVLSDTRTGEVAIGQATCVQGVDLLNISPVFATGIGVATVQAAAVNLDFARQIVLAGLLAGTPPADILEELHLTDPYYEYHQYCIADVTHDPVTYTGTVPNQYSQWAGGRVGRIGDIAYSVAGNILTGAPVVDQAVMALESTPGDIAAKLMAAMQRARAMGGDGRCSCNPNNPTGCGSPPPSFLRSAWIGYMVIARAGDTADCMLQCSSASFFMKHDIPFADPQGRDPIIPLQEMYDLWRANLAGRPDAVQSVVALDPPVLPANSAATSEMAITLRDWQPLPITAPIQSVTVVHGTTSDSLSAIGPVIDQGNGVYTVTLTAGASPGVDRFRITVDDGIRPVILMPEPSLTMYDPAAVPGDLPVLATRVHPNMPNPLRTTTTFSFDLAVPARAALRIVDLAGRPVATALDADLPAGHREVRWNGMDASGRPVASGVYFYELRAGGEVVTRKFAVVR